jgi:hypothetical protein
VVLNERLYDLDTLLKILQKDKLDPFTKYEFTLRDIQPARKDAEILQKIIQQIKEAHQQNLSTKTSELQLAFKPKGI